MTRIEFMSRMLILGFNQRSINNDNNHCTRFILGPIEVIAKKKKAQIFLLDKDSEHKKVQHLAGVMHDFDTGFKCVLKRIRDNKDRI